MKRHFHKGEIVKHFKRDLFFEKHPELKDTAGYKSTYLYEILGVGKYTETGELMVIYRALYGNNQIWIRPYDQFMGKVNKAKYPEAKQEFTFESFEKSKLKEI